MLRMGVPVATPVRASDCGAAFSALIGDGRQRAHFEAEIRDLLGSGLVVSTSSGRAALFVVLEALRRNSCRREVVIPAYACPSIGRAVLKAGLQPVLCDVGRGGSGLAPAVLERTLSSRTLAVVVAHLYGYPCDIQPVIDLSHAAGAVVIEDAAQAFGATWQGRYAGTMGDAGIFSFGMSKVLWSIGGGLITTSHPDLAKEIGALASTLPESGKLSQAPGVLKLAVLAFLVRRRCLGPLDAVWGAMLRGKNDCDDFTVQAGASTHAAVARRLLKRLSEISAARRENALFLTNHLATLSDISLPEALPEAEPVYLRHPVIVKNRERKRELVAQLRRRGINVSEMYARPSFDALRTLAVRDVQCPQAEYLCDHMLNLPTHPFMKESDLAAIVEVFRSVFGRRNLSLPVERADATFARKSHAR